MITRRIVLFAGILLCALPFSKPILSSTLSGTPAPFAQDMNFTLQGKITGKTANKLTVSGDNNMIFHVVFNDKTDIKKKDGTPGTAQDLHIGVTISAAGDLAESGEITAQKIVIEGDGSGK